jgi:hypothetical protein
MEKDQEPAKQAIQNATSEGRAFHRASPGDPKAVAKNILRTAF